MPVATDMPAYACVYDGNARKWHADKLAALSQEDWRRWVLDRVRGRDSVWGYGREEYPEHSASLFDSVAAFCRRNGVDLDKASRGAALALKETDPAETAPLEIENAMWAARFLSKAKCDYGADTVRGWLKSGVFLIRGQEEGHFLHASALAALAVLQALHGDANGDVWAEHFREMPDAPHPFFYVATAFAGKSLDAAEAPVDWVVRLLEFHEKAEKQGVKCYAANALMPFWRIWNDSNSVSALKRKFAEFESAAPAKWELLRELSKRWNPSLRDWDFEKAAHSRALEPRSAGLKRNRSGNTWTTNKDDSPRPSPNLSSDSSSWAKRGSKPARKGRSQRRAAAAPHH